VPSTWLTADKLSTKWPPFKSAQKIDSCVRSCETPGENWSDEICRVIKPYDNYDFARRYALPRSTITSDLSDMEDVISPKHPRKKNPRQIDNVNNYQ
ncbi:unnamed protein product, partial [Allacma fusca]